MNSPITALSVAPLVTADNALCTIWKKQLPARTVLMCRYVYENHFAFLQEYFEFLNDETWLESQTSREMRRSDLKELETEKAKLAKELKSQFLEIKHYNNTYDDILKYVMQPIFEEAMQDE